MELGGLADEGIDATAEPRLPGAIGRRPMTHRGVKHSAPSGRLNASAGGDAYERAWRAVMALREEIDQAGSLDQPYARRLASELLAYLLSPHGRALLPHMTDVVARLLVQLPAVGRTQIAAS